MKKLNHVLRQLQKVTDHEIYKIRKGVAFFSCQARMYRPVWPGVGYHKAFIIMSNFLIFWEPCIRRNHIYAPWSEGIAEKWILDGVQGCNWIIWAANSLAPSISVTYCAQLASARQKSSLDRAFDESLQSFLRLIVGCVLQVLSSPESADCKQ